jgi:hypothetical protein
VGVEFGFAGHDIFSFPGIAWGRWFPAALEGRICGLKRIKIPGPEAGKRKNLRVLSFREVFEKRYVKLVC